MSADCATCAHHEAASPPVYGSPWTSRAGCAPPAASAWTSARTFPRYCVVFADHGGAAFEPSNSFSAIHGVGHAVDVWAFGTSFAPPAPISAGSAGGAARATRE